MAGFHSQKKAEVGCIACHEGLGPQRRLSVWALAGLDTVKFLAGVYEEPTRMRLPLPDAECRVCHSPILKPLKTAARAPALAATIDPSDESTFAAEAQTEGRGGTAYHALRDHDGVSVRCVRCHTSHTTEGGAQNRFISKPTVQPVCRECHKQM